MKKLILLGSAILVLAAGCSKQPAASLSIKSAKLIAPSTISTQPLPVSSPSPVSNIAPTPVATATSSQTVKQIATDNYVYSNISGTGSDEAHSVVWDITKGKVVYEASAKTFISALHAANGNLAFEEQEPNADTIKVINTATGAIRQTVAYTEKDDEGNFAVPSDFQFSPDGNYVAYYVTASVGDAGGFKKQIIVQNLNDFSIYKHLNQKTSVPMENLYGWTSDNQSLIYGIDPAAGRHDGLQPFGTPQAIWQIAINTGKQISLSNHAFVDALHYVGIDESGDASLVLTNLKTGTKTTIQQNAADTVKYNAINSVEISPDGSKVVYTLDEDSVFADDPNWYSKTYLANIDGSNRVVEADSENKSTYPYIFIQWIYGQTALFYKASDNSFSYGQFGQQNMTALPSPSGS